MQESNYKMENTDDIFDDFEDKVEDKRGSYRRHHENDHRELLKKKYQEELDALKHDYQEDIQAIPPRDMGEALNKDELKPSFSKVERFIYIGIVVLLLGYLITDLSFFHGDIGIELGSKQEITTSVVKEENKNDEVVEVEKEKIEEEPEVEEPSLSGTISLVIDKVYTEIDDNNNEIGYISKVAFTINNGKNKVLIPEINVYVYDDELDEIWETRIRGQFIYMDGINPGDEFTAEIDLVPKTYRNLNLKKYIRIALNDTEDGFITAINDAIIIS